MRNKQETVTVHRAAAKLREHMEEEVGLEIDTPEYNDLGVSPIGIHYTRAEQEEAVITLVEEMADSVSA